MVVLGFLFSLNAYSEVKGVDHVGLAVLDLDKSQRFFVEHANFKVLGVDKNYPSAFLHNGSVMVTLWQVKDPATAAPFDRRGNVGLHHLALQVDTLENLKALHAAFEKDPSVKVEFAPEKLGDGPTMHMMVYEPSGNRLEFVHRP